MHSALYYPFTGPKSSTFLKSALFLWDTVDFIVPSIGYNITGPTLDSAEAIEIIGNNYVPTEQDKRETHEELADICNKPLSPLLNYELQRPDELYDFYPQKFFCDTWEMLADSKLAKVVGGGRPCSARLNWSIVRLLHDVHPRGVLFSWTKTLGY